MYLIAIECSDLETEYKPLVDELVAARNISVVNVSTVDLKNAFVAKEYQKEFYGEGQQWFNMKRLKKDIQISESNVLDGRLDKNYKMLIPNDEDLRDNYE